jgi:nicotinate-nucleotide adenylyltransferase
MLKCFEQWCKFEEILKLAEIAVVPRDGEPVAEYAARLRELYGARITVLEHTPIEISSSRLRSGFTAKREKALEMLSPQRMEHSLGTECEAVRLAEHWGENPAAAGWAALLHDCTKHWSIEKHLQFCDHYDIIPNGAFIDSPKLMHSVTAAAVAEREFGAPREVVEAVRKHTTGEENMTALEKIIYIADKIEPTREYSDVCIYREFAYRDLNLAMLELLSLNIGKLAREQKDIHEITLNARNFYMKESGEL